MYRIRGMLVAQVALCNLFEIKKINKVYWPQKLVSYVYVWAFLRCRAAYQFSVARNPGGPIERHNRHYKATSK